MRKFIHFLGRTEKVFLSNNMSKNVYVLVACEESQAVCLAMRKRGIEAFSCDLFGCSGGKPEWHIKGDVLKVLRPQNNGWGEKEGINFETEDGTFRIIGKEWDLMIAHPPCTFLSVSGARWLYNADSTPNEERHKNQQEALDFVKILMDAPVKHIAIENPVSVISSKIRKPEQIIQPWQFGHGETKKTCFWLKNLPLLKPTKIVEGREGKIWKLPPSADRAKLRSKTYPGIAEAMAAQWGEFVRKK